MKEVNYIAHAPSWAKKLASEPPPRKILLIDVNFTGESYAKNTRAHKLNSPKAWLRKDGHRAWGFAIYRSTYQSDADWKEFMRRLLADTTESLEDMAGPDLLDNLALTVFDDP
ncbi:unnamed protein product [Penicillium roqueforti FM164]|uniref:Genomic scaffold, ProqFM164S03 n=1 Tax=Penicillium roqueforti (strain FM164) TaxID=1365484 RepID=W6QL01_PENRF|nr:unnamed protein product [Penicillium roqueforti FM164]